MTTRDTTDMLGGLAVLLAMALFAAARRSPSAQKVRDLC